MKVTRERSKQAYSLVVNGDSGTTKRQTVEFLIRDLGLSVIDQFSNKLSELALQIKRVMVDFDEQYRYQTSNLFEFFAGIIFSKDSSLRCRYRHKQRCSS